MMTMIEKVLARASGKSRVSPREYVTARIDFGFMYENFSRLRALLAKGGIPEDWLKVWDPDKFAVVTDHSVPPTTVRTAEYHKISRELARKLQLRYFYDVHPGIGHQIMIEKGHVRPGELIVCYDSHTTTFGAMNAAATGIGLSEMAHVIHTGELWFRVPETIQITVSGRLSDFVVSKDVLLYFAGKYGTEVAQYKAIEWTGPVIEEMSLDGRLTIGNMSVELGAKFGLFRADAKVAEYLRGRTEKEWQAVEADPGAKYAATYLVDGSALDPQVALPHNVGNVLRASEVRDVPLDQAVIATCCNGHMEDLRIAARILKGRKVHPRVRFYIAPASWAIYRQALEEGLLGVFVDAGVLVGYPSCGFCAGYQGVLAEGERCIAAAPRNFKGRMGSPKAEIYLGSPATVAASAIRGKITDPREVMDE